MNRVGESTHPPVPAALDPRGTAVPNQAPASPPKRHPAYPLAPDGAGSTTIRAPHTQGVILPQDASKRDPSDPNAILQALGIPAVPELDRSAIREGHFGSALMLPGELSNVVLSCVPLGQFKGSDQPVALANQKLRAWLEQPDPGAAKNAENSNPEAIAEFVRNWLKTHQSRLAIDIEKLDQLAPYQYAIIAGMITMDASRYNKPAAEQVGEPEPDKPTSHGPPAWPLDERAEAELALLKKALPETAYQALRSEAPWGNALRETTEAKLPSEPETANAPVDPDLITRETMDTVPVEAMLNNDRSHFDGVCRNYTEMFQMVWRHFVHEYGATNPQLARTHLKLPRSGNHIWVALCSVKSEHTVEVTQIDPTRGDAQWQDFRSKRPADLKSIKARYQKFGQPEPTWIRTEEEVIASDRVRYYDARDYLSKDPPPKGSHGDGCYAKDPDKIDWLVQHIQTGALSNGRTLVANTTLVLKACLALGLIDKPEDAVALLKRYLMTRPQRSREFVAEHVRRFFDDGGNREYWWHPNNEVLALQHVLPMLDREYPAKKDSAR